jgi:hypothetical protein
MSFRSAPDTTMVRPTGTIMAPPTPCSTRIPTSSPTLVLTAQPTDARVKTVIAARKMSRFPRRRVSQPLSGISTARVSR